MRPSHLSEAPRPHGTNRVEHGDPVTGKGELDDEEHVEEIFGQLWAIPNSEAAMVPQLGYGGALFWVRKDLVRERRIWPEDYHSVSRDYMIEKPPTRLDFARDVWAGGSRKVTCAEVLKKRLMVDGGRWVWQPDRLARALMRGRPQAQRGRGAAHQNLGRTPPIPNVQQAEQKRSQQQGQG
jgi:hypothetical protein